jgi:hypothetical protein
MNTYKVVFQATNRVTIQADRYCYDDEHCKVVSFFTGDDCAERVGTFYLCPGDYIKLIDTESDNNCSCSKERPKDND